MNYRFEIAYDGSRYEGWQRQKKTEKTIQGKIEAVLSRMEERPVEIQGAGRTDAGVHALCQTANARLDSSKEPEEIRRYLNRYLPEDIEILKFPGRMTGSTAGLGLWGSAMSTGSARTTGRTFSAESTFSIWEKSWIRMPCKGRQPGLREPMISAVSAGTPG